MIDQMRLDECCISISDGDHLPPPKSDCGVPFITISNIDPVNNSIDFSDTMTVPKKYYDSLLGIRKALVGDILYSVVGSFGIPVLIKENKEFVFQRHIAILRPNSKIVRPAYLYYIMKSKSFYAQADSYAIGSAQRTISLSSLRRMKVSIPSTDVQDQVIAALTAYDNLIEVNNKRIKVLEQMAENLYKEWFVRFRFPGHETAEFENGLPKGWGYGSLGSIASIEMGQSPESQYYNFEGIGLPFHQGVGSYGDLYLVDDMYSSQGNRFAEPNSIIFSVRAPVGRINITLNRIILGRGVASINSKKGNNGYLLWMLKNRFSDEDMIGNGAIFSSVKKEELLKQKFIIPSDTVEKAFDSIAKQIEGQIRVIYLSNINLTKQRDLLLPRLMSGKLEV